MYERIHTVGKSTLSSVSTPVIGVRSDGSVSLSDMSPSPSLAFWYAEKMCALSLAPENQHASHQLISRPWCRQKWPLLAIGRTRTAWEPECGDSRGCLCTLRTLGNPASEYDHGPQKRFIPWFHISEPKFDTRTGLTRDRRVSVIPPVGWRSVKMIWLISWKLRSNIPAKNSKRE
jgi:hypothetical protein